eukprot:624506-Rhodomonas_salina.1
MPGPDAECCAARLEGKPETPVNKKNCTHCKDEIAVASCRRCVCAVVMSDTDCGAATTAGRLAEASACACIVSWRRTSVFVSGRALAPVARAGGDSEAAVTSAACRCDGGKRRGGSPACQAEARRRTQPESRTLGSQSVIGRRVPVAPVHCERLGSKKTLFSLTGRLPPSRSHSESAFSYSARRHGT